MDTELDLENLPINAALQAALTKQLEQARKAEVRDDGKAPAPEMFLGMTAGALFAGLLISTLGLAYMRYAKSTGQVAFGLCGLALFFVPWFVPSALPLVAIGVVLTALPIVLKRFVTF